MGYNAKPGYHDYDNPPARPGGGYNAKPGYHDYDNPLERTRPKPKAPPRPPAKPRIVGPVKRGRR